MASVAIAAGEASSYEELRRRTLAENRRKLEELKLGHLSAALREAITSSKRSQAKPKTKRKVSPEGCDLVLRRSDRVANLDKVPQYRDMASDVAQSSSRGRAVKRRSLSNRVYASDEARLYAQTKAEEFESQLDPKIPSLVKPMLQSHTTGGFWLGLPLRFCNKHLPRHEAIVTLIDESGEEFQTKYLAHKKGLSGGWKGFAVHHELVDGDALVFQLIKPTVFKIYIIRASGYDSS